MRIAELRQKEVINECTCKRLGFATDVIFDICTGEILAIVVPVIGRFCQIFGRDTEYVIPFKCIKKIGGDIILVQVDENMVQKKYTGKDDDIFT